MSNERSDNPRGALLVAYLSGNALSSLLVDACNSMLGDEEFMQSAGRQHAVEYIGRLFDGIYERQSASGVFASEFPDEDTSVRSVGLLQYCVRQEMRIRYGDPELHGTTSSINPELRDGGLKAAIDATSGVEAARKHIEAAYAAQFPA